jgi:integrase
MPKALASFGASHRTVNYEVGCLRGILKHYGVWAPVADRVKHLKERHDVGKAVAPDDEAKLIAACEVSHSPALLPLFVLAMDTGVRASEIRALRRKDLRIEWQANQPIGEWKSAWHKACTTVRVSYRWHDLRHTFVSRLAENPNVSEETIRSLAGHVSRQMLQRYSHIRVQAKREAIRLLEGQIRAQNSTTQDELIRRDSPHNPPQARQDTR